PADQRAVHAVGLGGVVDEGGDPLLARNRRVGDLRRRDRALGRLRHLRQQRRGGRCARAAGGRVGRRRGPGRHRCRTGTQRKRQHDGGKQRGRGSGHRREGSTRPAREGFHRMNAGASRQYRRRPCAWAPTAITTPIPASSDTAAVPPKLSSGIGTPTTGSNPEIMPPFTTTYTNSASPSVPARMRAEAARASAALHRQRPITKPYSASTVATPTQPNSSASTAKMKSVVCSGT